MIDPFTVTVEARHGVTQRLHDLPIFKRSRSAAVYNFFAALEKSTSMVTSNPEAMNALGRRAIEATHRAIPAIFAKCRPGSESELSLNPAAVQEASDLLEYACIFDQVITCYELAEYSQFDMAYDRKSTCIKFTCASGQESNAGNLMRSRGVASKWERRFAGANLHALAVLSTGIRAVLLSSIRFVGPGEISFPFTPDLLSLARQWAEIDARKTQWELPDHLAIDTFTLADVKKFWSAVGVIANIHDMAQVVASNGDERLYPSNSLVNVKATEEWVYLISQIAGIPEEAATAMLSWHTYDPAVSASTAMIQPFIEAAPGRLCICLTLVGNLDFERNLVKLVNRHPRLRPSSVAIKAIKQKVALVSLSGLFPSSQFNFAADVKLAGLTNADLVVYERSSGFVLVLQHKWLTAPETPYESSLNDDELREGAAQAVEARDALRKNHILLGNALNLTPSDLIGEIQAAVITCETESSGFQEMPPVPIVPQSALVDLWAGNGSLTQLWKNLNERPDRLELVAKFAGAFRRVDIGEYNFLVPVLG
jgi:hypothetical protein